jgi:hypothetical protein
MGIKLVEWGRTSWSTIRRDESLVVIEESIN